MSPFYEKLAKNSVNVFGTAFFEKDVYLTINRFFIFIGQ
jgi:hypothetical protein